MDEKKEKINNVNAMHETIRIKLNGCLKFHHDLIFKESMNPQHEKDVIVAIKSVNDATLFLGDALKQDYIEVKKKDIE